MYITISIKHIKLMNERILKVGKRNDLRKEKKPLEFSSRLLLLSPPKGTALKLNIL